MRVRCQHEHVGLVVHCYHDYTPNYLSPACADCGEKEIVIKGHDWQRPVSFVLAQSPVHVARVTAAQDRGMWAGGALEFAWDDEHQLDRVILAVNGLS